MYSNGKNTLICEGYNPEVVSSIKRLYKLYKNQPKDHVKELQGLSVSEQTQRLFDYFVNEAKVRYKEDTGYVQNIKIPARLIREKVGDCKSFAMYFCCCLHCLGVPHKFRFVNFDGSPYYSHVYAVAIDENNNEIILDAVERDKNGKPIYNYARPYARKLDVTYYE